MTTIRLHTISVLQYEVCRSNLNISRSRKWLRFCASVRLSSCESSVSILACSSWVAKKGSMAARVVRYEFPGAFSLASSPRSKCVSHMIIDDFLKPDEVAALLGVSPQTVIRRFAHVLDVVDLGVPERNRKRRKRLLRIPRQVLDRVLLEGWDCDAARAERETFVVTFVRHSKQCPHRSNAKYRWCRCPKHLRWSHKGYQFRAAAGTRTWRAAERERRRIEMEIKSGQPVLLPRARRRPPVA